MGTEANENNVMTVLNEVFKKVNSLYDILDPVAKKFLFEIPVRPGERQKTPLVLVLGNHSAGKSTFINYLVGREIQKTGVAPTDDAFTVLTSGTSDNERDGQALIGTPEYGFGDLSRFGSGLTSHLKLKTVTLAPVLENLMLIDSPGMIDSHESSSRNYDFEGVVKWLAERSDIVLLLFDPDKPGTTGETLKVLTSSLTGFEHKLLIVFNKVDLFNNVHDFARAYGTLCWNLSKVISAKDLPLIFNTYIPVEDRARVNTPIPLEPFDKAREELIGLVKKAPERRIDNMVTQVHQQARQLLIHVQVCAAASRGMMWVRNEGRVRGVLFFALLAMIGFFMSTHEGLRITGSCVIVAGILLGVLFIRFIGPRKTKKVEKERLDNLTEFFTDLHRKTLLIADQGDLKELWNLIQPKTRCALETLGLNNVPSQGWYEQKHIVELIDKNIPTLRSMVLDRLKEK